VFNMIKSGDSKNINKLTLITNSLFNHRAERRSGAIDTLLMIDAIHQEVIMKAFLGEEIPEMLFSTVPRYKDQLKLREDEKMIILRSKFASLYHPHDPFENIFGSD